VLESLEHFEELLEQGIPMARVDDAPESPDFVVLPRKRLRMMLITAMIAPGPVAWAILADRLLLG
jgi:hypothetical protein